VDGVVFSAFTDGPYGYPFDTSELVDRVESVAIKRHKPVALSFVTDLLHVEQTKKNKVFPIFDSIEDSIHALSTQWKYRQIQNRTRSPYRHMALQKNAVGKILSGEVNDLTAMEIASGYGIRCEMPVTAVDLEDAILKASGMGYPVAMKIESPDISHKTDVGGVIIDIKNKTGLEAAYHKIMDNMKTQAGARIQGVMLQKMIPDGMELIIGGKFDDDFGPVIMFGLGGIFVEAFEDVVFRMAPICHEEAHEMIEQSKGYSLLKGVRGERPYDISALADALERVSVLLADFPEIKELDLNPVKLFHEGDGLVAVDGRIRIG
jgi:acetyltransferase